MMLKRLARRWNPEKALKGETKYHLFRRGVFDRDMYDDAMVEEITEAWKKNQPGRALTPTAQTRECNCGLDGCEVCETDAEECTNNTRIGIPDCGKRRRNNPSPTWYAAPTGSPEGDELGMDAYQRRTLNFSPSLTFYWPHVYQYVQRSHEAMQEALERLYDERDNLDDPDGRLTR